MRNRTNKALALAKSSLGTAAHQWQSEMTAAVYYVNKATW